MKKRANYLKSVDFFAQKDYNSLVCYFNGGVFRPMEFNDENIEPTEEQKPLVDKDDHIFSYDDTNKETEKPVRYAGMDDNSKQERPSGERRPRVQGQRVYEHPNRRKPRPNDPDRNGQRRRKPAAKPTANKKKKWSKKKKALLIAIVIIGFLLIVLGAIVAIIFHYINMIDVVTDDEDNFEILSSIEPEERDIKNSRPDSPEADKKALEEALRKNMLENAEDLVSDDNVINILLIGCDARSKNARGRSDSMILLSINKNTKKVILTSFLRDTWVKIPGVGSQRLNAAYVFGGPKLLIRTMEANFHIRIDKYARVNFYSFMDTIDAVGGVDIEVTDEELEYLNDYVRHQNRLLGKSNLDEGTLTKSGKYTLNGVQALAYSRIRYVGTDFARTQRQRNVLEEIFRKARNMGLIEMNDFLEKLLPNITTNLEKGQIFSLILNASSYLSYDRKEQSVPNLSSFKNLVIDGMMVLGIDFEKYNKELKESIYG